MQVGYHSTEDDSVNSAWLEGEDLERRLIDIVTKRHIDEAWLRPSPTGSAIIIKAEGKILGYIPRS